MSSLTLGLAVERLPSTLIPGADPPDLAGFDPDAEIRKYINRVCDYFHSKGPWAGLEEKAIIQPYEDVAGTHFITLPRHLETLMRGGTVGHRTLGIQSLWYQFLPNGGNLHDPAIKNHAACPQDCGMGFCTFRDLLTPATLHISSDQTETGTNYIWIRGLDASGNKIFSTGGIDGIKVALSITPVVTTKVFSKITSVSKDISTGNIKITNGTDTIAVYEGGERVISYRRYIVHSGAPFVGMFKRKFQWAYSDNDPIFPDCMTALEEGIRGFRAADELDFNRGENSKKISLEILESALVSYNAGTEGNLQPAAWITAGIHNMR